jgi:microcystin-dependent protein
MEPFVGEIRMFGGSFAPLGWRYCDGSEVAISDYETLFMLIGTTYGGDGQSTFALPDLRGRAPIHQGQGPGLENYPVGRQVGVEEVALNVAQLPAHDHSVPASSQLATSGSPVGAYPAALAQGAAYGSTRDVALRSVSTPAGAGLPHTNLSPRLTVSFIIATEGLYPGQG